jgi:hypothetical protein
MAKNQSKKSKKHGRAKAECQNYRNSNRREKNKLATLKKHLARFPDDAVALAAVENCTRAIRGY